MSFDREALIQACKTHGFIARVVVAKTRGSVPREVGAAMLVWKDGAAGTIGGGTLEYEAIMSARRRIEPGTRLLTRHALGPDLGQCCGGSVDLLTETFDLELSEALPTDVIVRGDGDMPLVVARIKASARNAGQMPPPQLISGWMVEPVSAQQRDIWIWGAGHVGRALVQVLSPLPQLRLTWIDTRMDRFPEQIPAGIEHLSARHPEALVRFAPKGAEHLIVTYSHQLDLQLCHHLLVHGFQFAGLIGSATKWARFRSRLQKLGHTPDSIARITCPIGQPSLGKEPHAIAIGVGSALLSPISRRNELEDTA